jgi:long-chain acyl-CoA synthetase
MNKMDMVCVPLYDTLGSEAVQYIVQHSETKLVIASGIKLIPLEQLLVKMKNQIKGIVYWGDGPEEVVQVRKCNVAFTK